MSLLRVTVNAMQPHHAPALPPPPPSWAPPTPTLPMTLMVPPTKFMYAWRWGAPDNPQTLTRPPPPGPSVALRHHRVEVGSAPSWNGPGYRCQGRDTFCMIYSKKISTQAATKISHRNTLWFIYQPYLCTTFLFGCWTRASDPQIFIAFHCYCSFMCAFNFLGVFVSSFSLFFISFWEIQKLDGYKSEKLMERCFQLLAFESSNF
jgi:hypothetical protein